MSLTMKATTWSKKYRITFQQANTKTSSNYPMEDRKREKREWRIWTCYSFQFIYQVSHIILHSQEYILLMLTSSGFFALLFVLRTLMHLKLLYMEPEKSWLFLDLCISIYFFQLVCQFLHTHTHTRDQISNT